MKKALFTDTLRRIWKTRGRFFAIMAIIAIGCGFFAGVKVTSPDMKNTAEQYYRDKNLMDIRLVSTFGFTSDEIKAIAEADSEIDGICGGYSADMFIKMDDGTSPIARVYSVNTENITTDSPDYISHFTLLEGRMPERADECLIEADTPGVYHTGDTITLMSGDSETATGDILANDTFTITGKVSWVKYVDFERGTTTIGNGSVGSYLVIPDEAFSYEYYTDIYMTLKPARELYSFGDEYQDYIDEKCDSLETLCSEIHRARLDDIRTEISDAEQELADGEKEYSDGVKEFDTKIADAEQEIADAEQEIADAEKKLADGEKEIADAEKKLADGEKEYSDGVEKFRTETGKAEKELADGEKEYRDGLDTFNSEIKKAEDDIRAAEQKISDSESQLNAGQAEYSEGLAAYTAGEAELEAWKTELEKKQAELDYAASQLPEESLPMLDSGYAELNAAKLLLEQSRAKLDASLAELEAAGAVLEAGRTELENGRVQLESGKRELESKKSEGMTRLEDARIKIENGRRELEKQKAESMKRLDEAKAEIEKGRKELEDGKKELEDGRKELEDGIKELEDGKKELEEKRADGLKELADARQEIEDGRTELNDAKSDFDELCENLKWYVFDRNSNTGYSSFGEDADRVDSIARIFPVFFILVAALVCLNTMTRMVEEQRTEIGTLKALGYSNGTIVLQFLIYSAAASIVGSAAGMLIGFNLFPRVIFQAYTLMYDYPPVICSFRWDYAAGCVAVSLLCTCAASGWACMKELSGQPAQLMRPKPPKNGKRVLLERIPFIWKRLSFNAAVTVRNISRYRSRVLMTVIGIGGCTALMLTGFGLRNAISVIVDLQFGGIIKYDAVCAFDAEDDEYETLHENICAIDEAEDVMFSIQKSITVRHSGKIREAYAIVPERPEDTGNFISLRRRLRRNAVHTEDDIFTLNDSGVIINEKLAKLLNISAGDEIGFEGSDRTVIVSAVTENYSQNYVYFTPELYTQVFGEPEYNVFWINFAENADENRISSEILENSQVLAVNFMSNAGKSFRDLIKSLNAIVYAIIGSSGALAFVVLYNLSNLNISERMRELATIKVLGFYDGEVAAYIYRENTVSALLGMAAGLFGGIFLCNFVVKTAEVDVVMFYPDIPPLCFLCAAVLTLVFTLFVNAMLYFRLKNIDMAGSMKAIE